MSLDEWIKCISCMGHGWIRPFHDQKADRCTACNGTGELPKPAERPKPARRVKP